MDAPIARESMIMGSLPARHARYRPHHAAVVIASGADGEHPIRLTWREFDAYVNRWANAMASLGVSRGDRVATVLANSLELLANFWSCAKLGAIAVPVSPLLTAAGLGALIADASPCIVVGTSDQLAMLSELRLQAPPDTRPILVLTDPKVGSDSVVSQRYSNRISCLSKSTSMCSVTA